MPEKLQGDLSALYGWWKFLSWRVQLYSVHVLFLEIVDLLVASCDGRCVEQNVARHHIMYILSTSVECCIFRHLQHLVCSSIKAMSTSCWNHLFCVFLLMNLSVKLPTHNVTFYHHLTLTLDGTKTYILSLSCNKPKLGFAKIILYQLHVIRCRQFRSYCLQIWSAALQGLTFCLNLSKISRSYSKNLRSEIWGDYL